MLYKQLIFGVLAIKVSSTKLTHHEEGISHETRPTNLLAQTSEGTEWKLKDANEKIGNIKYTRPHEKEVFDLGSILSDFYDQVGMKYGDQDFGTFTVHGAPYQYGILPVDHHDNNKYAHTEDKSF